MVPFSRHISIFLNSWLWKTNSSTISTDKTGIVIIDMAYMFGIQAVVHNLILMQFSE